MFRKVACVALVLGLMPAAGLAAPACEGADCALSKPLDITKFMREQAASTRGAGTGGPRVLKPKAVPAPAVAKAKSPVRRAVAARPKPAPVPAAETASSFAPHDKQPASPFAAAFAPRPETTGAAPSDQSVRMVSADELNEIDRMAAADSSALSSAISSFADAGPPAVSPIPEARLAVKQSPDAQASWYTKVWSGVAGTFVALSTAVHQLTGL